MAEAPRILVSSLSGTRYQPAKFWIIRLLTLVAVGALFFAIDSFLQPMLGRYDMRLLVNSLLFATLAVSLNLINGITGQFSMGHAAFYLTGAIVAGKVSTLYFKTAGVAPWQWLVLMCLLGGIAAAVIGLLVGVPSLRLRGDYLAVMTMGFGEIARVIVINQDGKDKAIAGLDLGGSYGLQNVEKLTNLSHLVLLLIFAIAVSRNLLKTAHGLTFLAVREDELAASATGVNTTRVKVTAFVIGAALAGMAGALFAHYNRSVSPDDFKMDVSFMLVAMVVIGGTGSITGAAIAGFSLKLLEEGLRELSKITGLQLYSWIAAAVIVLVLVSILKKHLPVPVEQTKGKMAFTILGALGTIGIGYLAYKLWGTDISVVIKVAMMAIAACSILALTGARHTSLPRFGFFIASMIGLYVIGRLLMLLMGMIGPIKGFLGALEYQAADLRWAAFSVALILVMIMRPQGIMSHHELSWDFLLKPFHKRKHAHPGGQA